MAYCNDYSWSNPVKNGKNSKWFSILIRVAKSPCSKRNLLSCVWNKDTEYGESIFTVKHDCGTWRGWNSKLFACMNSDDLIKYNKHTKLWELDSYGEKLIAKYS